MANYCRFYNHYLYSCENQELKDAAEGETVICKWDENCEMCPRFEMPLTRQIEQMTPANETTNNVNHPNHYCQGGIECIKAIEASMPADGFQDYCKGNVLKYIWRWRDKAGVEDLKKARVYLNWMIESAEKGDTNV